MQKEAVVYTYNGILFSLKQEGNPIICDNMDGLLGYDAKWSKSDREKRILYDLAYMWNLKKLNS